MLEKFNKRSSSTYLGLQRLEAIIYA